MVPCTVKLPSIIKLPSISVFPVTFNEPTCAFPETFNTLKVPTLVNEEFITPLPKVVAPKTCVPLTFKEVEVLISPTTSNGYDGKLVLIPTLSVETSTNKVSPSTLKSVFTLTPEACPIDKGLLV